MAHEELWQQLAGSDWRKTSQRAMCKYLPDPEQYYITMLNTEYTVNLADKHICSNQSGSESAPADFIEQLCLLAYLNNAKDLPLADKLVKAESLPGGQFFFRGHHALPTRKLEDVFGRKPELLFEASARLNAKKREFGDASMELLVLPRIPLVIVVWAGDEEFEPRASILLDPTVAEHLVLDAITAVVNLTVDTLLKGVANSS